MSVALTEQLWNNWDLSGDYFYVLHTRLEPPVKGGIFFCCNFWVGDNREEFLILALALTLTLTPSAAGASLLVCDEPVGKGQVLLWETETT